MSKSFMLIVEEIVKSNKKANLSRLAEIAEGQDNLPMTCVHATGEWGHAENSKSVAMFYNGEQGKNAR